MSLSRSSIGVDWRSIVVSALPSQWSDRSSYRIRAAADEIATWAGRAPLSAWDRKRNPASLLLDLLAAEAECGPAVRAEISPAIQPVVEALELLRKRRADLSAAVGCLEQAIQPLLAVLTDPAAREAAWTDIVDVGRIESLDHGALTARVELLMELIAAAGGNPNQVVRALIQVVQPSAAGVLRDPDAAPDYWTEEQRVNAGKARIRESGPAGQCVVWLDFHEARIPDFVTELGRVTLFDSEWCIGNIVGPPKQDFPFKDELAQGCDLRNVDQPHDYLQSLARQVIARVDLGRRSTHQAVEDAEQTIAALNVVIPALVGAPRWQRGEQSAIVLDGVVVERRWGPSRESWPGPDHYGLNGFSDALDAQREMFACLLGQPLPVDVAEALRLIDEAGQVDSRENALNRTATIADRSVIVLQLSALERLAIFGGLSSDNLGSRLSAIWPNARYWVSVKNAVENAVGPRGGPGDDLSGIYTSAKSGRRIDLRVAYERRQSLIDGCTDRLHAARAAALVYSLGDAPAALGIIAALRGEATYRYERALRCRNALVHGSPVSDAAVLSVRPFVRYMVDSALNMTLDGLNSGSTLSKILGATEDRVTAAAAQLAEGQSHYQSWCTGKPGA